MGCRRLEVVERSPLMDDSRRALELVWELGMPKKTKLPLGAKAAFVRANPDATAQQVVALGKKQGIPLTLGHVYNIRTEDRKKQQNTSSPSDAGPAVPGSPVSGSSVSGSMRSARGTSQADAELRSLVLRVGLDRADQILADLKSRLSRMA